MGVNNIYRYVNAAAVYTQGRADGVTTHTGTYTIDEETELGSTIDLGVTHTYRYVEVPAGGTGDIAIYAATYYVNSSSEVVAVDLTTNTVKYTTSPPYNDSWVTLNPHGQNYGYWSVTAKVGMTYSYGVGRGGFGQYAAYNQHANAGQTIVSNWCRTAVFVIHSLD